ncbi:MAG: NADH-quinone oxidoreductase subunit C [Euryarchaeota archaeon]|nr:NADH-quinone oxidoreductase subunit C [Euryarchaeota archaeon]
MSAAEIDLRKKLERMSLKSPRPRLIDVIAADRRDGTYDLIYVFHHEGAIVDHRYVVNEDDDITSIADLYAGALCMEREIIDMYGLKFNGVTGGFLLDPSSPKNPLRQPRKEVAKDV